MAPPPVTPSDGGWLVRVARAGPLAAALWVLAIAATLWLADRWLDPTPDKRLVIATGPEQEAYAEFAKRYVPLLRSHGVEVQLRATQGSAENLARLLDAGAGVHAAFVQGGHDRAAGGGGEATPVVSLGRVAYEPLWLFYRAPAADRPRGPPGAAARTGGAAARPAPTRVDGTGAARAGGSGTAASGPAAAPSRLAGMAGWRINTGPAGGGAGALFARIAAANGLDATRLALDTGPTLQGVVALVQGRIDAVVMVAAADAPLVQYLLQTPGVALFPFVHAEAYARRFPDLRAVTLPRGLVDLAADRPAHDVPLVAATASLVARADLHPALMQLLLQAARQVHGEPGWFHGPGELPSAAPGLLPLAPEAERFYRDGPPWLQRYLPFWLANFIDRMWIVLLPLLAALVPLSRVLPPLVSLRLRSRVFRWYAHLRAIEREVEAPGADLRALSERLEGIDRQVEHIGLPLSYTNELYQLRAHINLVRKRLAR